MASEALRRGAAQTRQSVGELRSRINALPAGQPKRGAVEIADSGRYSETLAISLDAGSQIELRARDTRRPTLLGDDLTIEGEAERFEAVDGGVGR